MEELISYQIRLMDQVEDRFFRFLFDKLPWDQRFIAIKGPRGSGKTTMLLQYARFRLEDPEKHLYLSLDHPYFYKHGLVELADEFHKLGGKTLLIDEIHKYPNWSREIKHIYDGYPKLQLIITSSSVLDLYRGEADLSRRVASFNLPGLSFREFLNFDMNVDFKPFSLEEILADHLEIARSLSLKMRPLALFRDYLRFGYYPFFKDREQSIYQQQLFQAIETTLFQDISFVKGYSVENVKKMQNLLGVLAETVPFEPNISSLAEKLGIGRNTLKEYLFLLGKAKILNLLSREGKGISVLQKPDKVYLENTNFSFALKERPDSGSIRETFFLNQMLNAGYPLFFPGKKVDFTTKNGWIFEIGGKGKRASNYPDAFMVKDGIEIGFQKTIPLWLFGFLY